MYHEMYSQTSVSQELLIKEGISFQDCLIKILNGVFFMGKKVVLSLEINQKEHIDFTNNAIDSKYDYDTYEEIYKETFNS